MPQSIFRSVTAAALLLGTILATRSSAESDSVPSAAENLRTAWQQLTEWIGSGANGDAWRRYLYADRLEAQLANAASTDPAELQAVLARFDSGAPGLDRPRFVAVREQLWQLLRQNVSADTLPAVIRSAKGQYTPPPKDAWQRKREEALDAAKELDAYLQRGGDEYRSAWHTFLNWETLEEQLAADEPNLAQLNTVLQSLYSFQAGMELPIFTDLRTRLHAFMNATVVERTPNMAEQYDEQLEQLAANIEGFHENRESARLQAIGRGVGWLNSANQAPAIQRLVREHFAQPNFYARVSADFITRGVNEPVDETMEVRDCILGTSLYGTARTLANVQLALLPNPHQAELALQFRGTAYSHNIGTQRGVTIYSTGQTALAADKSLYFDAEGLAVAPSRASANTQSNIYDIQHHLRLVERLAWRQAAQQQPRAEAIASRNAAGRLQTQFDERTAELLGEPQRLYYESFRLPLLRRGQFPELMHVATTHDAVVLRMLQAGMFQVGAPTAPPELDPGLDVAVRLHETFVGNMSEALLGGFTLTDEKLVKALEEANREVPDELKIDPNKDPWSITFADNQPIQVQFSDQRVRIGIRGKRFTRGEQRVTDEMEISAVYNLTRTPTGAKLTREGEVQAEYTRQGFENAVKIAVKTLMRQKFSALFKEELVGEGVELEGRLGAGGFLRLGQLVSDGGWLVAGWTNSTQPAQVPAASEAMAHAQRSRNGQ